MAVVIERVSRTVAGEPHLIDVDLALEAGAIHVLLGHTRAGKTSLLRIIAGLDRPTAGAVRFDGVDVTRRTAQQRSVALVYQQFINYPSLTVRDNIASPLQLRRAGDIDARVRELARLLRIDELLGRLPGELSGGQQQRVAIARALARDADVVLLDEPLVNLDYKLREDLRDELRGLFAAARPGGRPITVVYATTDPGEALALGGTTVLLHEGRVLQHAPALDVYHRPASVVAAGVASDPPMNIVDGVVGGGAIELAGGIRIPLAGGADAAGAGRHLAGLGDGPYRFGIRASDCRLAAGAAGGVAVVARVELSEISGSETFVHLRGSAAGTRFIVQHDGVLHPRLGLGDELAFYLDPDRLLAFGAGDGQPLIASYRAGQGAGPAAPGVP